MTIMERLIAAEKKASKAHVIAVQSQRAMEAQRNEIEKLTKEIEHYFAEMHKMAEIIKSRASMAVDVTAGAHQPNRVILTGQFHNRPYVEIKTCNDHTFEELIRSLKSEERYAKLEYVDAPRGMDEAIIKEMEDRPTPHKTHSGLIFRHTHEVRRRPQHVFSTGKISSD